MLEIKAIDGTAVRCQAGACGRPAVYLFAGDGTPAGVWAYCAEHASEKARELKLELPEELAAAAGAR